MKTSSKVPIRLNGREYLVDPEGRVETDFRACTNELEEVRFAAGEIFVTEKRHELTKPQFEFWHGLFTPVPKRIALVVD